MGILRLLILLCDLNKFNLFFFDPSKSNLQSQVAFGYEGESEDIIVLGNGTEGLASLEKFFTPDSVVYAVLAIYDDESEAEGYATVKYIFISWVGPNVKPTWKALSSQHRVLLYNYVNVPNFIY